MFSVTTMGRIKTKLVKRVTNKLISIHSDKFKKDFKENKSILKNMIDTPSKKIRNIIAGYVTRIMKSKE